MANYKVLNVKRYTANAAGVPFKGGTRTVLTLEGVAGEPSFFDKSGEYASLNAGGFISGEVQPNGKYLNFVPAGAGFSKPSGGGGTGAPSENTLLLRQLDKKLDMVLALMQPQRASNVKLVGSMPVTETDYETMDQPLDDLPF